MVYFEPEVDNKYKLPIKPRLVLVPDSEILMVSLEGIILNSVYHK